MKFIRNKYIGKKNLTPQQLDEIYEGRGFPRAGRAAPRDFSRVKTEGNSEEQPLQPEKDPVFPTFKLRFTFFSKRFPYWASLNAQTVPYLPS